MATTTPNTNGGIAICFLLSIMTIARTRSLPMRQFGETVSGYDDFDGRQLSARRRSYRIFR